MAWALSAGCLVTADNLTINGITVSLQKMPSSRLSVEKVSEYRKNNPGLGCAKLYLIVRQLFENTGSMPGRDAFIELLRKNGLMVRLKPLQDDRLKTPLPKVSKPYCRHSPIPPQ